MGKHLTDDERANIRMRIEANETYESLAEDYDVAVSTIKRVMWTDEQRAKELAKKRKWRRGKYNSTIGAKQLREKLKASYFSHTGHDLLADLQKDARCRLPRNSSPHLGTNTVIRKHSSSGSPSLHPHVTPR